MGNWFIKVFFILFVGLFLAGCGESERKLTSVSVTPSSATVGVQKSQRFYASAYDQKGQPLSSSFTWSVSNNVGTVDSSGMFYAGSSELSGSVTAATQGISGSAAVNVTTKGIITGTLRETGGTAVPGVLVYLSAARSFSDTSTSAGKYTISGVAPGTWEVATREDASHIAATKEVVVITGETVTADITVFPRLLIVSEVIGGTPLTAITGLVHNNGTTEAKGVTVSYLFYDDSGMPVGGMSGSAGNIPPLSSSSFSAFSTVGPIDSYYSYTRTVAAVSY